MLQLLLCSDVHTFTDNIRLALKKAGRVDAVLAAGDTEAEMDSILTAAGTVPLYIVCGNSDYYLNSDYPEELLIDISIKQSADTQKPSDPVIEKITELHYSDMPETVFSLSPHIKNSLPSFFIRKLIKEKRPPHILHRILMTHGKEYNVPDTGLLCARADLWDADIVIFGHTHKFTEMICRRGFKRFRFINPGCLIGNPKNSPSVLAGCDICCFALLEIGPEGEINVRKMTL